MAKTRRGGYVFITWKGDHDPRHAYVFKDDREVLTWNLESGVAILSKLTPKLRKLIDQLVKERKPSR